MQGRLHTLEHDTARATVPHPVESTRRNPRPEPPRVPPVTNRTSRAGKLLVTIAVLALAACSSSQADPSSTTSVGTRAVVVVSGFAAESPFTAPTQGCGKGLAVGVSSTALRDSLIAAGFQAYTAPAQVGPGQIKEYSGFGPFSQCPPALPESVTVNALEPIDEGGQRLSAFINYLRSDFGVGSVDIVAHSMGGLFSRSAIKALRDWNSPVAVNSLTTIGTPWEGSFAADVATGELPKSVCGKQTSCIEVVDQVEQLAAQGKGSPAGLSTTFLDGADGKSGWNAAQAGALDGIPVTLFAGNLLNLPNGNPRAWPNDGLVQLSSALAPGVSDAVLPHRSCQVRPDVHSAFFTNELKLPRDQALTWDPVVLSAVNQAVATSTKALAEPNRTGCP